MLYASEVVPFLVLLHVALTSCSTFFVLHSFRVALFSYYTLFKFYFFVSRTFRVALSVLDFFHFALFLSSTFFVLRSFFVALFPCCTLFMSHLFSCCTVLMLYLLCTLFMLHVFRAVHFPSSTWTSCWTFFRLQFSWCTVVIMHLFVCCTPFMWHLFSCFLVMHCNHVALFRHLGQRLYWKERLHSRCFPGKSLKFLRSPILENIGERRLQKICSDTLSISKSHNIVILQRMNGLILLRSEAVVQRCSVKRVFLEISQNSQKTPGPESLF